MGENQTVKTPLFSRKHIVAFIFLVAFGLIGADYYVGAFSKGKIFNDSSDIPQGTNQLQMPGISGRHYFDGVFELDKANAL